MFLATISEYTLPIGISDPIIFDLAPINPGGNYDTVTGGYTAPVDGYYQYVKLFSVAFRHVNKNLNKNDMPP